MNPTIKKISKALEPYKGILLFLFLLFFFHFSWKLTIDGDSEGHVMYFLGRDCTPDWFATVSMWVLNAVYWFVHLFPDTENFVKDGFLLYFTDGDIKLEIIWGCTGVKQLFIFTGIMLFYRGPFKKKLWYIPMGWFILSVYNIIRVGLIAIFTRYDGDSFDYYHDGIFRYIYYGIIFLLWVIWEEFIYQKQKKKLD